MDIFNRVDELKLYRGGSYRVTDDIIIRQPTLGEICEYGEIEYFNMVHTLCSVGADMKWQLDEIGVDYTKIGDFELFFMLLSRGYNTSKTKILFGDKINFSKMEILYSKELEENVMIQKFDDGTCIRIDRYVYGVMIDTLRKIHRLKRNDEKPGNEATRQILIEDAKEVYEYNKTKPKKSMMLNLISAMVNMEGFKHDEKTVFDMYIFAFMDSVARIGKIKNADLLLQSGYSGFGINLKEINKEQINWMGDLT